MTKCETFHTDNKNMWRRKIHLTDHNLEWNTKCQSIVTPRRATNNFLRTNHGSKQYPCFTSFQTHWYEKECRGGDMQWPTQMVCSESSSCGGWFCISIPIPLPRNNFFPRLLKAHPRYCLFKFRPIQTLSYLKAYSKVDFGLSQVPQSTELKAGWYVTSEK